MADSCFTQALAYERAQRHWSYTELARRSGLSRGYLSRLERGQSDPSLTSLKALARGFAISLSQLLDWADDGHLADEEDDACPSCHYHWAVCANVHLGHVAAARRIGETNG